MYANSYLALCNIRQQFVDDEMKTAQPVEFFQEHEIKSAIESLNSNQACDESGIYAEHLTNCKHMIAPISTRTFYKILEIRKVPEVFKAVIAFPVLKQDKVPTMVNIYRGITVTPIIRKILEYSMLKKLNFKDKSELQFGFTTELTPLMSNLIISESRYERMPKNTNLIMGIMDVQSYLLDKLFDQQIHHILWTLIKDMYSGLTTRVNWLGELSESFPVLQGVRRGGILSKNLYKMFVEDIVQLDFTLEIYMF